MHGTTQTHSRFTSDFGSMHIPLNDFELKTHDDACIDDHTQTSEARSQQSKHSIMIQNNFGGV